MDLVEEIYESLPKFCGAYVNVSNEDDCDICNFTYLRPGVFELEMEGYTHDITSDKVDRYEIDKNNDITIYLKPGLQDYFGNDILSIYVHK